MSKPKPEDYLMQGIYGKKELKPDEKRRFLGTFRERVVIALKQSQVREKEIYKEVEDAMDEYKDGKILLNGHMEYSALSKYIELCAKKKFKYTVVTNKEYNSEYGLVFACNDAVHIDNILIEKKPKIKLEAEKEKKGVISLLTKVFKK